MTRRDYSWPAFASYLFHPLFVPLYAVGSYFWLGVDFFTPAQKYLILIQVFLLTVILPLLFFLLLRSMGRVASVMIPDPAQRKTPLLFQMLLLYLLISRSMTPDVSRVLFFFFTGAIISSGLAFAFLYKPMKISLHALSMSAWLGFFTALTWHFDLNRYAAVAALTFLTGAVMSARLLLKAHTPAELVLGFACGLFPQLILSAFWL